MALRARKVSGAFEKQAPDPQIHFRRVAKGNSKEALRSTGTSVFLYEFFYAVHAAAAGFRTVVIASVGT